MFKFLKEKVKAAVDKVSKKVEEEAVEETVEVKEQPKKVVKNPKVEKKKEEPQAPKPNAPKKEEVAEEPKEEKKGFLSKLKKTVTTKKITKTQFDDIFWELEVALLENNVAVEVIEKIKQDLEVELVDQPIKKSEIENTIEESLKTSIKEILTVSPINFLEEIKKKKPYVICFLGVNGSGKTTTIAKIAYMLKKQGIQPVLAAADTFRAAAIDQLEEHAKKIDVKIIKHEYGSDAAAVAFDAIEHAKAQEKEAVLIDTAGRMHSNRDLLDELNKIIKVSNPDMKIFVGESITGNDCVEQAQQFNNSVHIDGIILSKADIDEKGGAPLSVSYVTKKPILYIGTGQKLDDLEEFNVEKIIKNLGL